MKILIENYFPDYYYDSINHIDLDSLKAAGIKGFILDIDNTLVAMHVKEADENAIAFVNKLKSMDFKVCILSNATQDRVVRFNKNLSVQAVHRAFKPSGKAFLRAARMMELHPENVAVVGDQIFTDIRGGNKVNMTTILVKPIDKREIVYVRAKRIPEMVILKQFSKNDKTLLEKRKAWKKKSFDTETKKFKE